MFATRPATTSDAAVIGDLLVRSARFAYAEIASPEYLAGLDPEAKAAEYGRRLAVRAETYAVFLAIDDNTPLGFAELAVPSDSSDGPIGLLHRMYFLPESLGRGLGPVLHATVIEQFAQWGCTHAELTVVRGNERALSFYVKQGWTETGEIRSFDDHGRTIYDVVMRRAVP